MRRIIVILIVLATIGCAARSPYDRIYVSQTLEEKTGHALSPPSGSEGTVMPPAVVLEDGLSEDEAVAIALWNNAQFRADMGDLALARAGLIESGMLPNPLVSYLNLFGVKGQEGYILWPLDALLQRPKKMAMAKLDVERVAARLVHSGLTLSRDVLVAYADLVLAGSAARIAGEEAVIRGDMAKIAAARYRSGDISGLEETSAQVAGLQAEETVLYASRDLQTARARLTVILGWGGSPPAFAIFPAPAPLVSEAPLPELIETACAARSDLRAAQIEIDAAGARLGWEKAKILKLTATLEGKEKGDAGAFFGPSGKLEIPLFNRNEGGRARAQAEMEKAARTFIAVRQRIVLEVTEAKARLTAARQALSLLRGQVVPAATEAASRARLAYAAGQEPYIVVLEAERQLLEARRREAFAAADVHRADAQLKCGLASYQAAPDERKTEKRG